MRSSHAFLVVLVLCGATLAGCLGGSGGAPKPKADATGAGAGASASNASTNDTSAGTLDASDTNKSLGAMPHMHDYWKGRERVTLMDNDVVIDAGMAMRYTFFDVLRGTPGVGGAQFTLPDEQIVYEGTGKMEVTLTWTDATITGTGLSYRSPASPQFAQPKDMKSGAPLSFEVTPDMCDMPHSKTSAWSFLVMPDQSGQVVFGKIHVRIDVLRMRDITLFPAHPDFWHGAHELTIFKGSGSSTQSDFANQFVSFVTKSAVDDGVRAQALVPMETMSMTGNLTIKNVQVELGKVSSITLLVKPANSNNYVPAHLVKADSPNNLYYFAWLVDMRMADGAYAKESNWKFDVRVNADPTGQGAPVCQQGACTDAKVDYDLEVKAYDTPIDGATKLQGDRRGGG
jgi:hypothetical protein